VTESQPEQPIAMHSEPESPIINRAIQNDSEKVNFNDYSLKLKKKSFKIGTDIALTLFIIYYFLNYQYE